MSPLPERKKSPEELAQLRESFGVPPDSPAEPALPQDDPPLPAAPQPVEDEPAVPRPLPEDFRTPSLRRHEPELAPAELPADHGTTRLPGSRHNDRDLRELNRRETLSIQSPAIHLLDLTAKRWLIAGAYAVAIAGIVAACFHAAYPLVAGAEGLALATAIFIALRKPRSRHHGGFIGIIAALTLVFATLHHFPAS